MHISSGTVELSPEQDLGFTPIRKDELQLVAVSIGSGSVAEQELLRLSLGQDLVSGTPVSVSVDFSRNPVTVTGGLKLRFEIDSAGSPSAQDVVDDLADTVRARASVQSLTIDSAAVNAQPGGVAGQLGFSFGNR